MRCRISAVPMLLLSSALAAQMPGAGPVDALDGLDPVLLVQGKEVPGKSAFSAVHAGFTYLFSSADKKAVFERSPGQFAIQLGGLCARMGKATGGNPSDYLVHDGKIYIFGSDECHKRFQAQPAKYLPPPPRPISRSADAAARGRKLLDEAARAMGPSLDTVRTFVESISQVLKRAQGEAQVSTRTTWQYPDRVRQDRRMNLMGKTTGSSTLVTPDGAWYLTMQGQAYPILAAGRPSLRMDFGRHPVALLANRRRAGFTAVAEGPATVDGAPVERVRIVDGPIDVTLNLDAARKIHSVSFQDRNAEGVYGAFTILYSNYRTAEGLNLPSSVRAFFDGQPDSIQSYTVDSFAVNPPIDQTIFTPGSKPAAGH